MWRFTFREPPLAIKNAKTADPQKIGEAIERHAEAHNGRVKTRTLLDEARASRHPMHRHIEWNDRKAAEAHRLDQVRELCRVIMTVNTERPKDPPARAFYSVNDVGGRSYRTLQDVIDNAMLPLLLRQELERSLLSLISRFAEIESVTPTLEEARGILAIEIEKMKRERQHAHDVKQRRAAGGRKRGKGTGESRVGA